MHTCLFRGRTRGLFRLVLAASMFSIAAATHAATFCITTGDAAGLSTAMLTASSNGESDVIKLQAGFYSVPANFLLSYSPTAADQGGDLSISGGYGPTLGDDCGLAPTVADASVTILEGGRWRAKLSSAGGSFSLSALTLQSTYGTDPTHASIEIGAESGAPGGIAVENVMFLDNASLAASAISIYASAGTVLVRNSLFASSVTLGTSSPVEIGSSCNGSFCTVIANSTFVSSSGTAPALKVDNEAGPAILANSILWNNVQGGDIAFSGSPSNAFLLSNDIQNTAEVAGTHLTDLYSVDPKFKADYSLDDFSALRDKGNPGTPIFGPGTFDVVGNPRVYFGVLPDIGAFEIQDVIFAYDFDIDFDPH